MTTRRKKRAGTKKGTKRGPYKKSKTSEIVEKNENAKSTIEDETPLFKVEHDPTLENFSSRGMLKHLVPDLVKAMEKLGVNDGHIKIEPKGQIENETHALSLYRGARRMFDLNPRNKYHFKVNVMKDAKKRFKVAIVKRIA